MLSVRDLNVTFDGRHILNHISFDLSAGETMVVRSGLLTGATTLIKAVAGLVDAEGEVIFQGVDLLDSRKAKQIMRLRSRMGIVYEAGGLLGFYNIYNNIALPLRYHTEKSEDEISALIKKISADFGIDHLLSLDACDLNDIQIRLVNLVRALVMRPLLLLVDELEGGMTKADYSRVLSVLQEYQREYGFAMLATTSEDHVDYGEFFLQLVSAHLIPVERR